MKDRIVYAAVFALFVLLPAYAALSAYRAHRFEKITTQRVSWTDAMFLDLTIVGWEYDAIGRVGRKR